MFRAGLGGRATATIAVTPGDSIQVNVGGRGGSFNGAGGFNGGGTGSAAPVGTPGTPGSGGGGASDIRIDGSTLDDRVLVAGGGGGGGAAGCSAPVGGSSGGGGGGELGGAGTTSGCAGAAGGGGGTQTEGGSATSPATKGDGGVGGNAAGDAGGGGGGGWFGGGGGLDGSGGGGGSGHGPEGTVFETGVRSGNGLVTVTYRFTTATLTTSASPDIDLGGQVTDTATLANGVSPTGQITFRLYGPDDANCSGAPAFTDTKPVSGNGSYQSAAFAPAQPGLYRWVASYSGDADNVAVAGACNDTGESVTVAAVAATTSPPSNAITSPPSNEFTFGKLKRNLQKGTAKLTVKVPGGGELELAKTKKVKADDESAEDAGKEKLLVKPRGKAKKKLNQTGKAKVKAKVTYTPTGGEPNTESKTVTLKRR